MLNIINNNITGDRDMKEKKKLNTKINAIKNNKVLLGYVFKFAPEMFIWKLFAVIMILISDISFNVIFLKYVIDAMGKNIGFETVLLYIAGLALVRILCDCANTCYSQYIEPVARLKIHKGIYNLIYKKIEKVDLEKFDDTGFYNDYIWALNQVDDRTKNTFNIVMQFIQSLLNVLAYTVLSMLYDKVALLFVIVPVCINVVVGIYKAKISYKLVEELTPVNRQRDYSRRSFYLRQYAKEIRTYGVGSVLLENFNTCVDESINITKKYRKRLFFTTYSSVHSGWIFAKILSAIYMSYQVLVAGAYSVGVFIVIYQAIGTFTNSLSSLFAVIPNFQENGLFAERILKIINYKSKIESYAGKNVPQEFQKLELKNLSFQYPHSKEYSLKNINLTIHKGEKIALVGMNGAGKSTLIKLILRLYDPTEGTVSMNDKDIKEYTTKLYRDKFTTIFQDYQIYALKLIENIFMRRVKEEEAMEAAGYMQDSNLFGFEDKLWNNITKEFDKDGIVFSGGQSQKVAIARSFAKNGEIIIMDEPSSSLDPIAENEINHTVLEKSRDKSIIVISHRLSSIQHMDKIYFMENGEITESGTHKELINSNGKYAEMYNVQAEKYRIMERENKSIISKSLIKTQ